MSFPERTARALLAAVAAALLVSAPGIVGGATADTTPAPTSTTATTPLTMAVSPTGGVSFKRLAGYRQLPVEVKTSGPAQINVEFRVPAKVARELRLKVAKGETSAVLTTLTLSAKGAGYVYGWAPFSKGFAKRLAAKPRRFRIAVIATSGPVRATGYVQVNKKD